MSEERIVFMENFRDTANVTEAPTRRFDAHEQVNLVDHSSCMDAGEDGIIIGKVHSNMSFFGDANQILMCSIPAAISTVKFVSMSPSTAAKANSSSSRFCK